jgi:hypothetical protein
MTRRSQARRGGDIQSSPVLGRGEIEVAGVPAPEIASFRDWARRHLAARYFDIDEPLARSLFLIKHAEQWAAEVLESGNKDRGLRLQASISHAKGRIEAQLDRMQRRQMRRLPTLPDPATVGAVPTSFEEETELEPPRARAGGRGERLEPPGGTEGEERWDPAWGDPNVKLPPVRPQGMRKLPDSDVAIPPKDGGRRGGRPKGRPS